MPEAKPTRQQSEQSAADPGLVARLGAKARKYYELAKDARKEADTVRAELAKATADLTEARKQADGNAARKEAEQYRAELRTMRHRQIFDQIAKDLKVRPEALDDLVRLSEYKAEADTPDPEAIKALIAEQAKTRPFLFGDGQQQTGQQQAEQPKPGPGRGQGGNSLRDCAG